ncbi:MAG: DNA polymerase IV [Bacteroidota bacterium]
MNRSIVHMDLDSFFVSVERLLDSSLHGKPVIIGGTSDRGVVASCSYEARKFGVHSAMPSVKARQLCPQAIFVRGDMHMYSKYSREVTEIIRNHAPAFEKASIDEHYLDITGMDKYVKNSLLWTKELRGRIIHETGLPISFGLSANKTVSKITTGQFKPNGEGYIEHGKEKEFLAPLSISKIPGLGKKTYPLFEKMGLEKMGSIQKMTMLAMKNIMGEHGISIWKKANGIDNNPIESYSEQTSMSTETTFEKDSTDLAMMERILIGMVNELAFDLRQMKRVTGCVTVKIKYTDFQSKTFQATIPYTASDHVILQKVKELFAKNYMGKEPIRLIGVKFSNMVDGFNQINLFEDTEEKVNLYSALDKIRLRFGSDLIMPACGQLRSEKLEKQETRKFEKMMAAAKRQ